MDRENFISNELKNKIINNIKLTDEEINKFFRYVIYKVHKIIEYKETIDNNLSKEYTALYSEILFSHNLETIKREINNHYFCIVILNKDYYLCDLCQEKYKYIKLNDDIYKEYISYIKENYNE